MDDLISHIRHNVVKTFFKVYVDIQLFNKILFGRAKCLCRCICYNTDRVCSCRIKNFVCAFLDFLSKIKRPVTISLNVFDVELEL